MAKIKRLRVQPHEINSSRNDEWQGKCFQVMGNRGKFTLHKNGLIFLKEGNSSMLSTVTIHSFQEIEGIV